MALDSSVAGWCAGCSAKATRRVVNLDKLTYAGNLDSLATQLNDPRHTFVRGDIGDWRLVTSLLEEHQPLAIFHLAAESHVDRSIDAPATFVQTNVVGTFQLLEAAPRLLVESSRSRAQRISLRARLDR